MTVRYNLLRVDVPNPFGGVLVPRHVVQDALNDFRHKRSLELCRYEPEDRFKHPIEFNHDEMIGRISETGLLLEVIGRVTDMWIDGDTLKCECKFLHDNLFWPLPEKDYMAVPYMDFRHQSIKEIKLPGCKRVITEARFTEIVLVYQAVTKLAVRKFQERNHLSIISN